MLTLYGLLLPDRRVLGPTSRECLIAIGFLAAAGASRYSRWPVAGLEESSMSRVCQVTGKRPMSGNNVSHAHNKTRRRFLPNLHTQRFWLESESRFVKLKVSHKGLRIIDKMGIEKVVERLRLQGQKI
jgi:large subunit ribosomal protein L28